MEQSGFEAVSPRAIVLLGSDRRRRPIVEPGRQLLFSLAVTAASLALMLLALHAPAPSTDKQDTEEPQKALVIHMPAPRPMAFVVNRPRPSTQPPQPKRARARTPPARRSAPRLSGAPSRSGPPGQVVSSAALLSMVDGRYFEIHVVFPDARRWKQAFLRYGGSIGISDSLIGRPAYVDWSLTPAGVVERTQNALKGKFVFRLDQEAIVVVNSTLRNGESIPDGNSAFGMFPEQFKAVVAGALRAFAAKKRIDLTTLSSVRLEFLPSFGLEVVEARVREP